MRLGNLFTLATSLCLTITQVKGAVYNRAEPTCSPVGGFDAILPILNHLDCNIKVAKTDIVSLMASSPDTNQVIDDIIVDISGKMLDSSANLRKLNWTVIETYAQSADGSRLLLPKEIGPASQPYFSNLLSLMTVIRDHVHSKHRSHSHKRLVSLMERMEHIYGRRASLVAGSNDYVSFASAVNFTGELHIQGGASVLNVQLNNVQLGLYNGEWAKQSSEAAEQITQLNSTLTES
ncbi:unnamed protein product [Rhizoctonia solani]|uniref:Uncharacterized protein n=1 Tax=Rhizoctonia solani TaxID=456999 RepID=A0A8H3E682_9AGAM|nr:unnamed protein product [Rhizoctonia solani]